MELKWQTPASLRQLLSELVGWDSRTLTEGEKAFSHKLKDKLGDLLYFQQNTSHLQLHDAGNERFAVTALYKHASAKDTIVLISHFDTVHTEEFGDLGDLAFKPEQLTDALLERKNDLPDEAREDLESGEYLFGRGTMDMKMGLALHMRLIEKASVEQWPINLVLVTVPDEEVNSAGMRAVVPALLQLQETHELKYKLFLNGEPSFTQEPGDENHYIYSGSIGKIMPTALFYGKETHVGEPLSGMTANYIASFLTQRMEWNTLFQETDLGENTPLPVSLQQKDLKMEYSTQTPYRGKALYNVFLMKRDASEIMDIFKQVAEEAADACNAQYKKICERENVEPIGTVTVITYEKLLQHATNKLGKEAVNAIKQEVVSDEQLDDREKSVRIADLLMLDCQELGPAIVLLYTPPYYPAVNASDDSLVAELVKLMKKTAEEAFDRSIEQIHYFNGISDLSYVSYKDTGKGWNVYQKNTPVWGATYEIPFSEMTQLDAPVLNVGPFGKDAHKLTERLHKESAFIQLPYMLDTLVKSMFPVKESILN
ncbi:M20/M25/M40 family metallo-hydrolase [Virgibacillus sp. W0430]|uniref:M20/M25/M40 family metallo-hydrolase n=1 Tax=Virgibacillus sp. W0430 TaxID=3391580 RepID=UPI003F447814